MCQLLGLNSSEPSEFCNILSHFAKRGGEIDVHRHGWGLAFYNNTTEKKFCIFHDVNPAAYSPKLSNFVLDQSCTSKRTTNMISHIRYATKGCVSLENVHPFIREMWGTKWVFAHNGDIPNLSKPQSKYIPNGTTDSEAVFCKILNELHSTYTTFPPLNELYQTIQKVCLNIINNHTEPIIFNFLLSINEDFLFAFSWPGKRPGSHVWNGLYYQIQQSAIIATKPLDVLGGGWVEMKKGELLLFYKGLPYGMDRRDDSSYVPVNILVSDLVVRDEFAPKVSVF